MILFWLVGMRRVCRRRRQRRSTSVVRRRPSSSVVVVIMSCVYLFVVAVIMVGHWIGRRSIGLVVVHPSLVVVVVSGHSPHRALLLWCGWCGAVVSRAARADRALASNPGFVPVLVAGGGYRSPCSSQRSADEDGEPAIKSKTRYARRKPVAQ